MALKHGLCVALVALMAGAGEAYVAPQFAQAGALDNQNSAAVKRIRNLGNNSGERRSLFGIRRQREERRVSAPVKQEPKPVAPEDGGPMPHTWFK